MSLESYARMMRETRPEPPMWTMPAAWCSCDPLRKAEAERDRYRAKALRLVCNRIEYFDVGRSRCERCAVRLSGGDEAYGYCDAVIKEVDGE